jgi:hypothetical protein
MLDQEKKRLKNLAEKRRKLLELSQTIEVSTITPPVISATLSNQNSQSHQSPQSTITSSSTYTHIGNLRSSMADEMRLPIFSGDGSEDSDQHCFLCEFVWNIKNVTDEDSKRAQFITTLRDRALSWYMKLVQGLAQPKPMYEIKNALIIEFKKPKWESQCIMELKEINKKVA